MADIIKTNYLIRLGILYTETNKIIYRFIQHRTNNYKNFQYQLTYLINTYRKNKHGNIWTIYNVQCTYRQTISTNFFQTTMFINTTSKSNPNKYLLFFSFRRESKEFYLLFSLFGNF